MSYLVLESLREKIAQALLSLGLGSSSGQVDFVVEPTREKRHGDFATNVAFLLARLLKRPPREVAQNLKELLEPLLSDMARVEVAGGGFINFTLKDAFLLELLQRVLEEDERFGEVDVGKGVRIQVEFVSVNPTGPLHVGHGKCAAFGDALARILAKAGFAVEKEYYINDAGKQIELLGASLEARFRQILGEDVDVPEGGYRGEYLVDIARELLRERGAEVLGLPEEERNKLFREYAVEKILAQIRKDLDDFRVFFDVWFSERSLYEKGEVDYVLSLLQEKGYTYEQDGALWLKTTLWGDDKDRVLIRENGAPTYFASDIAYHWNKWKRGFERVIDIWGADHHGYIPRMHAAMRALGLPEDFLEIFIVQFVTLLRGGQPERMSTRQGEFVPLRSLIDEVGVDAARYYFLMRDPETHLEFDVEEAKRQSMDNPVYYVQYAHARIVSVFREAQKRAIQWVPFHEALGFGFENEDERDIARAIVYFPEVVKQSALLRQPYLLCNYLHDLAGSFHSFYNLHRILDTENVPRMSFRLALCRLTQIVLRNALELLGISVPESM
ncbi:MAG: arginine--tRNA ligase [Atribacterota bacterium]